MDNYETYVRKQLTLEQSARLDDVVSGIGTTYFNTGHIAKLLEEATDIESRISREIPFLAFYAYGKIGKSRIFDACLGSGATTIGLIKSGVEVVSNDLDDDFIALAKKEATQRGIDKNSLKICQYDWRELSDKFDSSEKFDAVICTGNSLTYIMQHKEQQEVITNFSELLKPGGKLVIDTRNYTELLRGNLRNEGTGPYSEMYKLNITPMYISTDMVMLRYTHKIRDLIGDVIFYPFKDGEIECMMQTAGLENIELFGDYHVEFDSKKVDFYTIIGKKPWRK